MGDPRKFEVMETESGLVKSWTRGVPVEEGARKQLRNVANMPFIHKWVAAMPDVHWGMGATIGSVIPTINAVIPAAVGVDLGCGIQAVRTTLTASDLPDNLSRIRAEIEKAVPHGRSHNGGKGDVGAWDKIPTVVSNAWEGLDGHFESLCGRHGALRKSNNVAHLGTLGTGNHFIEICLDKEDRVWIMLHSGSRGVGAKIGGYFIKLAKEEMRRWHIDLPDRDLAYFPEGSRYFGDYIEAVGWAQRYASLNRELMMTATIKSLRKSLRHVGKFEVDPAIECVHNYINKEKHYGKEVWVTRKGAVSAKKGQMGIIPGSMGNRSYIVRGLGNKDSFHSCSHGAGRAMSRGEAKRTFTLKDHRAATEGVECRKDKDVIDETPGAYKNIEAVMAAQSDLVEIVHEIKQVICVKG